MLTCLWSPLIACNTARDISFSGRFSGRYCCADSFSHVFFSVEPRVTISAWFDEGFDFMTSGRIGVRYEALHVRVVTDLCVFSYL